MSFLPKGYALVEVVPLGGAPGVYTYAVPPQFVAQMNPGRRVLVPFGARRHTGIVLGPGAEDAEGPLREIEGVVDSEILITPEILALVRWAADYYGCSLSLSIRSALPPGADAQETRNAVLSEEGQTALTQNAAKPGDRRALRAVESGETQVLAPGTLKRLVREGLVALEREVSVGGNAPEVEVVVRREDIAAPVIPARHRSIRAVWDLLAVMPRIPFSELQQQVPSARDAVKRLVKRGLVGVEQVPFSAAHPSGPAVAPPALTDEQQAALTVLEDALTLPEKRPFLLEGVTGSGKTEVYLRLITTARARGGRALVLVPEIALTPQLSSRFRARFGAEVAVLHSGLTDRDRLTEWHRIRRGEASIVVGARSAVFAPLEKPAVVIVDEEHDPSFKQAEGLRYHGRDLAVVRAKLANAVVVLGSATPALETVFNAERGRYGHLRLTRRIDSRPMPAVAIVDLKGRLRSKIETSIQPSDLLSGELIQELRETVARQEQAIVFLNRRGHSTALLCRDCGQVRKCAQCSVAMTWHERRGRLVCHYCGAREPATEACPKCHSTRLLFSGAGTEKLEEELGAAVPGARISRLDRDTAGTATRLESILSQFGAGEIDILVGTQMVAKGHDFPGVTLVGVLMADSALHQPDFRAAERTAQLLNQVAGRAGRGTKPGRVLLQAFAPEALAIQTALTHDYASFARAELAERDLAQYPPFRRLCLLRIDGEDEAATAAEASAIAKTLHPMATADLEVLGPGPMSLARLRGRYRFQVLIKATRHGLLRDVVTFLRQRKRAPGGIRMAIDIDPVDML